MYMVTRGSSMMPLIKLTEGHSFGLKDNYVTVVCGSNGEKLKPIKVWDVPFVFFNKEKLNAEFISKTELIYVKVTEYKNNIYVDVVRYRLPEYMIENTELEYDVIRKTKPNTEIIFHIGLENNFNMSELDELDIISDGVYKDAIMCALYKMSHKDELCFCIER